ncbi:MAG TPA: sigma-70 family RNA polymerase sigma factor, partial [Pyrinomonadaceae bacterium]
MLNPRQIAISPEDFFAQRYGQLLEWSLHLTGGDRAAAEDLLHDLFILFTLRQPDFEAVTNLEGYVYTMLRNLHLSQLRRATRVRLRQLTIVDFESAELGLRVVDAHERIQARDELRRVCDYVCLRKERSKSASVLILRFFHGYYPSEIARLLKVTRKAVDVQLLTARNEARLFLECPATLSLMGERLKAAAGAAAPPTGDFLWDLRELIFRSRRGACLSAAQLTGLYGAGAAAVSGESLAHIVSCARCLDAANRLLGLPSLAERYPMNTLIRDATKKGGGGDDGPGGAAGGGGGALARRTLRRWRRHAGEVFEHKPRELCVSVNGYAQGSRRISSEVNDLQLF